MVKVFEGTPEEYYMDGYLKSNLDIAKRIITEDWDIVLLIDGYEGSGKSVFAQQIAKYCDPNFNIDRIVFTPDGFKASVLKANKFEAIVYDEAFGGMSSSGAISQVNKILVRMMTEIRHKNLFIIVVLPSIFILQRYYAILRTRALLHVFTDDDFKRGYFDFYNADAKKKMYMEGYKTFSYNRKLSNFYGRFTNHYTVDKDEYKQKKLKETTKDQEEDLTSKKTAQFKRMVVENLHKQGFTYEQIGEVFGGMSKQSINHIVHKTFKEELAELNQKAMEN